MKFSEFSNRFDVETNEFESVRLARIEKGLSTIDIISGNLNEQGFFFPQDILTAASFAALEQTQVYKPHPAGHLRARKAIAAYYEMEKVRVNPNHIVLTPGTSVSYQYLFQTFADPGDEILAPQPSYPLFETIAAFSRVHLKPYSLIERRGRWEIDLNSLEDSITHRTRAIIFVSPHNPTGSVLSAEECSAIATLARTHQLPVIIDEVFSPFVYTGRPMKHLASEELPLAVTLNGFSKMFALAGLKIGWMALSGQSEFMERAQKTLELISDTFLPVSETAQAMVPPLLSHYENVTKKMLDEARSRRDLACRLLGDEALTFTTPEGGFYLCFRLPESIDDEQAALQILKTEGVLTHPGYFYDLPEGHLVINIASPKEALGTAIPRLGRCIRTF